jgi:hypothetical protein
MSNFVETVTLPSGEKKVRFAFVGWAAGVHE